MSDFKTKDSGERLQFASGMVRDIATGKFKPHLTRSGPMYRRWCELLSRGAEKYGEDNWLKANGEAELKRFRESALRHFEQWFAGETDEDHAAAVFFNINGAEYVKERMEAHAKPHDGGDAPDTNPERLGDAFAGRMVKS